VEASAFGPHSTVASGDWPARTERPRSAPDAAIGRTPPASRSDAGRRPGRESRESVVHPHSSYHFGADRWACRVVDVAGVEHHREWQRFTR